MSDQLRLIEWGGMMKPQVYAGNGLKGIPLDYKYYIANQALPMLAPHVLAGHMVNQTVNGLVEYMDKGLASAVVSGNQLVAFAKLYPYQGNSQEYPVGYEFSTWLSAKNGKGLGTLALTGAIQAFINQGNMQADLFAVCSSDNPIPQKILLANGGVIIERPDYVPNMLASQNGENEHPETIIDMKGIIKSSLYADYAKQQNIWGHI